MALRGELWQTFLGIGVRRVEGYYSNLLNLESDSGDDKVSDTSPLNSTDDGPERSERCASEKWKGQIEKDLARTCRGYPDLNEDGRNALRRLLTAYARHKPSVGYCQAMNFCAGLLLLLMPEESAFWAFAAIIDDYFNECFSVETIESKVDQLVLDELVRKRFPKLVNHLDYLGVQVAWVTGPWFFSIFVNSLPWESVLRVWDVLLFDGNRVMLFRTALALMEFYEPALVDTKAAGDAVTLLHSLAGSTFDSNLLVLTASTGYQAVNELRLEDLRKKHRPAVLAAFEERTKGTCAWKDSQGVSTKLYSFKHGAGSLITENRTDSSGESKLKGDFNKSEIDSANIEGFLSNLTTGGESNSEPDFKEQTEASEKSASMSAHENFNKLLKKSRGTHDGFFISGSDFQSMNRGKNYFELPLDKLPMFDISGDVSVLTDISATIRTEENPISRNTIALMLLNKRQEILAIVGHRTPDTTLGSSFVELRGALCGLLWGKAHVKDDSKLLVGNDAKINFQALTQGWTKHYGDHRLANRMVKEADKMRSRPYFVYTGCTWLTHWVSRALNYEEELQDVQFITWAKEENGTFLRKDFPKGGGAPSPSFEEPGCEFWDNKKFSEVDIFHGGIEDDVLPDGHSKRGKTFISLTQAIARGATPFASFIKLVRK